MSRKINLFVVSVVSALLLTMCRFYDQNERLAPMDGLSCLAYTDYFEQGLRVSKGLECYYTCPGGVAGPFDFEADPSLSNAKEDLDRTLCSGAMIQNTPTEPAANTSTTPIASPTLAASPTAQASSTPEVAPTSETPLLTGEVTMCDGSTDLISFRIVQPPPDLSGSDLRIQISDAASTCSVNPTNPSLLTCTIPPTITFPARVVVNLDDVVVNDFTFEAVSCIGVTPIPAE